MDLIKANADLTPRTGASENADMVKAQAHPTNGGILSHLTSQSIIGLKASDSPSVDAFSRWRVSDPTTLFDYQGQYDLGRLYWQNQLTAGGTATHNANHSSADLAVVTSGDSVVRQTREYMRYQPGHSQMVAMTAQFGDHQTGVTKRYGYYDDDNGVFFEQTAGVYNLVLRSSVTGSAVDQSIAQASWNLDKLDGTGVSGITLDGTQTHILIIDLQWLSVGRVRVGLDIGGVIIYCHQFVHANILATPYMTTANLPCRYEISSIAGAGSFKAICATVISEGGFDASRGSRFSASNGATVINVPVSRTPLLSIRPKATFGGLTTRGLIIPTLFSCFSQDKQIFIELVYGGTLTGAAFASVNADSIVEQDVSASALSGGIVVDSLAAEKAGQAKATVKNRYPLCLDISGAHPTTPYSDVLTVMATSLQVGTTDCTASMNWLEVR